MWTWLKKLWNKCNSRSMYEQQYQSRCSWWVSVNNGLNEIVVGKITDSLSSCDILWTVVFEIPSACAKSRIVRRCWSGITFMASRTSSRLYSCLRPQTPFFAATPENTKPVGLGSLRARASKFVLRHCDSHETLAPHSRLFRAINSSHHGQVWPQEANEKQSLFVEVMSVAWPYPFQWQIVWLRFRQ